MRSLPALLACLALAGPLAHAQENAESPKVKEGHSIHGEAFNEGPRRAGYLMLGQGAIHFPVGTNSGQAQAFVDQGVGQLHGFYYFEAERSFRQAATIDPACPMLYWGMAMANSNNADRAKKFLAVAQEKAKAAKLSRREQLYLDALAAKYKDKANEKARMAGWLQGLETVVQEFPDDLDARAWLAMVTWENGRRNGIGSRQAVSILLDSILERQPLHPGAHHYKIHLWDNVNQPQAEVSAGLYAKAQPGIAHAWHMPGHTYTGLKRFSDAAYQQEGSARVDHAYMKRDRVMPFLIHNYAHNNQWLAESLTRNGQPRKAVQVARNLVEQPRDPKRNTKENGGSAQRSGRQRWEEALVAFELWDDLIAAIESGDLDYSDIPYERMHREYALGLAFAGKGDADGLARQIEALKALSKVEAKPEENQGLDSNRKDGQANTDEAQADTEEEKGEAKPEVEKKPEDDQKKPDEEKQEGAQKAEEKKEEPKKAPRIPGLESALAELEGYANLLKGEHDPAFEQFKKASTMRKDALSRAYLAAGKLDDAIARAREAIEKNPREVAPQAVLVEALARAGKTEEARRAHADLLELTREVEPGLPVLDRLATVVAGWKEADGWAAAPPLPRTDLAFANRLDLGPLGPLGWEPTDCPTFTVTDHEGRSRSLEDYRGKNLVLVFFLGGQCAHCMQQLTLFTEKMEALRAEGTEVLAIGTDTPEATRTLATDPDVKFGMPLAADPGLDLFKRFDAHDDFEGQPLHATVLVDAEGKVRYQEVGPEPFLEVEFILSEAARVNRIVGRKVASESPRAASSTSGATGGAVGAGR